MKIKCIISYDGTQFFGSQIQPKVRTVQNEIEKVLLKMHKGKYVQVYSSGRTDAGVHARGQVIHFSTSLNIPVAGWQKALNAQLPQDILVRDVAVVPEDFHAQFDAIAKEYRYYVHHDVLSDVFKRYYTYHYPHDLNLDKMKQACELLEGKHDFTSFCSARSAVKGSKVRTLFEVSCKKEANEVVFTLRGDGFLYNMVRIIVGVLLDVGNGKLSIQDVQKMLDAKDRTKAGKTAPPEGLFLWEVNYEKT